MLKKQGPLTFMVVVNIILYHLVFSCCMYLIDEILLSIFRQRILDNGWADTPQYKEFQKNKANDYTLFQYSLPMFIPVLNVLCVWDTVKMIRETYI